MSMFYPLLALLFSIFVAAVAMTNSIAINFYKRIPFMFLFIFLAFIPLGYQAVENSEYYNGQQVKSIGISDLDMLNKDPVINLLGKSFDEIKQALGEPDEQGYSGWLGPHYYILFRQKEGVIRFASPEPINKIAVSIILGPGQEVLGAKVGMLFLEIREILGEPNFGPELGMDNLYYMDYFLGEIKNQIPDVFISFSAKAINSHTQDAFVKWEGFEYEQMETLQPFYAKSLVLDYDDILDDFAELVLENGGGCRGFSKREDAK